MKSILFVINEHDDISLDKHVADIAVSLPSQNFRTYVYSLQKKGSLEQYFRNVFHNQFYTSSGFALFDIWRIIELIRHKHIDIIQTPALRSDFVAFFAKRLAFSVSPTHVAIRHNFFFQEKTVYHYLKNILYILSCHLVDVNVSVARHLHDKITMKLKVPIEKARFIFNGSYIQSAPKEADVIRKKLRLQKNRPVILYVGAFIDRKNTLYLIEALKNVRSPFYCILVGQGPLEGKLREQIQKNKLEDSVFIQGHQPIEGYMSLADIFVLPSKDEGLSFALLEAMHAALPCLVSDIDANKELITSEKEGIIFPLDNVESLVSALERMLSERRTRKEMGKAARNKAIKEYDQRRMIREYIRMYQSVDKHI